MLSLSQTTGYAVKALGCLSESGGRSLRTEAIARRAVVPRPYLIKIIQSLARRQLVVAKRGIGGGISLARPAEEISLLQVVEAVEGSGWLGECLLGLDDCANLDTCPTYKFWQRTRREIVELLGRTTLAAVVAARAESGGASRLKAKRGKATSRNGRGCPVKTQGRKRAEL